MLLFSLLSKANALCSTVQVKMIKECLSYSRFDISVNIFRLLIGSPGYLVRN
jgi:hypothetical protein